MKKKRGKRAWWTGVYIFGPPSLFLTAPAQFKLWRRLIGPTWQPNPCVTLSLSLTGQTQSSKIAFTRASLLHLPLSRGPSPRSHSRSLVWCRHWAVRTPCHPWRNHLAQQTHARYQARTWFSCRSRVLLLPPLTDSLASIKPEVGFPSSIYSLSASFCCHRGGWITSWLDDCTHVYNLARAWLTAYVCFRRTCGCNQNNLFCVCPCNLSFTRADNQTQTQIKSTHVVTRDETMHLTNHMVSELPSESPRGLVTVVPCRTCPGACPDPGEGVRDHSMGVLLAGPWWLLAGVVTPPRATIPVVGPHRFITSGEELLPWVRQVLYYISRTMD
jgi:hypothetical protein